MATDIEVGCLPPPATEPSLISTLIRRKLPAFVGTMSSMLLNTPIIAPVRAQASLRFRPQGMASGLSRKSTSMVAFLLSIRTCAVMGMPSSGVPGTGSCVLWAVASPVGSFLMAEIMSFSL